MAEQWQVRVRASEEWRAALNEDQAMRYLRDFSVMFVEARVREVGPWRLVTAAPAPESDDSGVGR